MLFGSVEITSAPKIKGLGKPRCACSYLMIINFICFSLLDSQRWGRGRFSFSEKLCFSLGANQGTESRNFTPDRTVLLLFLLCAAPVCLPAVRTVVWQGSLNWIQFKQSSCPTQPAAWGSGHTSDQAGLGLGQLLQFQHGPNPKEIWLRSWWCCRGKWGQPDSRCLLEQHLFWQQQETRISCKCFWNNQAVASLFRTVRKKMGKITEGDLKPEA